MASLNNIASELKTKITGKTSENGHWGFESEGVGIYPCGQNEITFTSTHNSSDFWFNYRQNNGTKIKTFIFGDGQQNRTGNIQCGEITATKVYNAVWNDYAEFYEKGEHTEPGDIIGLNPNSNKEEYIKATNPSMCVGVHSDEYGHLIGGEKTPDDKDFVEYNLKKFIPVGLVGRVKTKIVGQISIGDKVVLSNIAGVGRKYIKGIDSPEDIIGMAVENKLDETISRIRVHLRMGGVTKKLLFTVANLASEVIQ